MITNISFNVQLILNYSKCIKGWSTKKKDVYKTVLAEEGKTTLKNCTLAIKKYFKL